MINGDQGRKGNDKWPEKCFDCSRRFKLKACKLVERPVRSCPLYKKIRVPEWVFDGAIVDVRSVKGIKPDHPGMEIIGEPFSSCNGPAVFVKGYPGYTTIDFISRPKKSKKREVDNEALQA